MTSHHRYYKFINTFFIVLPTTFVISVISPFVKEVFIGYGSDDFIKSWLFLLPIAYLCVLLLLPLANKMTNRILKK